MRDSATPEQLRARFEALFDESYEDVLAYARRRAPESADDIVAETFTVAWRRIHDVPADSSPWLYGVARRVLSEERRAQRRRLALTERLRHEAPRQHVDARADGVLEALGRLSELDREAILLSAWEGLSAVRAARAMGCSTAAFRVRLHRARRRLRARLGEAEPAATRREPARLEEVEG